MSSCLAVGRPQTRRWTLIACCLVALPFLTSAVSAATRGWMPTWDTAFTQLRVFDVGTRRTPLVGMPSTISQSLAAPASHPGPLHFWLLAVPFVITRAWQSGLASAQAVVNAGVAVAAVLAVRSSIGARAMWVTVGVWMAAVVLIGDEVLHDPWNPHMTLVALLGCAACAIAVVRGGPTWITAALVVTTSIAAQAHLSGLPPALVLCCAAGVALVRRARWQGSRCHLLAAGIALAVCWSGPVVDQIIHTPGNLRTLVSGAGSVEHPFGLLVGFDRLAGVLVPPGLVVHDVPSLPGGAGRWLLRLAAVALVVVVADVWRRRRGTVVGTVAGITLLLAGATWLGQAITPRTYASAFGGHIWAIMWPAAIGIWCVGMFAVGERIATWTRRPLPQARFVPLVVPLIVPSIVLLSLAAVAVPVFARVGHERDGAWFPLVRAAAAAVPSGRPRIDVVGDGIALESELVAGVAAELERRGAVVRLSGDIAVGLVHPRRLQPATHTATLWISSSPTPPVSSAVRLIDLRSPMPGSPPELHLYLEAEG